MPRTQEQNEQVREITRQKILDSALTIYVRYGYAGTVMDQIAVEAKIAKGLLYYYYKNKRELFVDLFDKTIDHLSSASEDFFKKTEGKSAIYKLVHYSKDIFGLGMKDSRLIQFAMRMPFDAYAVFGQSGWKKGMKGSEIHTLNLERIISDGISEGTVTCRDAKSAAASFWTVYVSGLFRFTSMMSAKGMDNTDIPTDLEALLGFGMAGLGVDEETWKTVLYEMRLWKNENL